MSFCRRLSSSFARRLSIDIHEISNVFISHVILLNLQLSIDVFFRLDNIYNQIYNRCRWFFDFVYLLICRSLSHLSHVNFDNHVTIQKRVCQISTRFILAAFDNSCNLSSASVSNDNAFSASARIVCWRHLTFTFVIVHRSFAFFYNHVIVAKAFDFFLFQ